MVPYLVVVSTKQHAAAIEAIEAIEEEFQEWGEQRTERADLVVEGLANNVLPVGVHDHRRHGVHGRVRDIFNRDGDIELPHKDLLVVTRRHEAAPLIEKRHRIDWREVVVVLLRDSPSGGSAARGDVGRRLTNVVLKRQ